MVGKNTVEVLRFVIGDQQVIEDQDHEPDRYVDGVEGKLSRQETHQHQENQGGER